MLFNTLEDETAQEKEAEVITLSSSWNLVIKPKVNCVGYTHSFNKRDPTSTTWSTWSLEFPEK